MKFIFYLLLLVYPVLMMLPSESNIGSYWGGTMVVLIIIHFLRDFNISNFKLNFFSKIGLSLFLLTTISIALNDLVEFYYFWFALKYYIALLIAGMFYDKFEFNKRNLRILYKISFAYLVGFAVLIFYRFSLFNFSLSAVIVNRDEIWLDKPVVLALIYSSFFYLYTYFTYLFDKPKYIKYIFILPLFIMGARSILIGGLVSLVIFVISDYSAFLRKRMMTIIVIAGIIVLPFLGNIYDFLINSNQAMELVGSQMIQNGKEVDFNNMSSGRIWIIQETVKNFSWSHLIQGEGRVSPKVGFVTHNDFLDFFFIYGLVSLLIYLIFFIKYFGYFLITSNYRRKGLVKFGIALSIFLIIQSLFNPFLSTLSSIFFFIIIVLLHKQWKFEQNRV